MQRRHDPNRLIRIGADGPALIRRIAANPAGGLDALYAIDGPFLTEAPRYLAAREPEDLPPAGELAQRLRLFHVNDLHNHLYEEVDGTVCHRIARMQRVVSAARRAAGPSEAVLFLSAGDDHTGTVLDELVGWTGADFTLDPGYTALSAAGADAAAIGNHEFDRGAAQLRRGLRDAAFPLLSANVHGSGHLRAGQDYHAAALAVAKGMRIGIAGLTTRVETRTGQPADPGLAVASPVSVLANLLPILDDVSDVVVILSHCGYGDGTHLSGKAVAARDIGEADFALAGLASELCRRPVVVVGAHTHTRLNEHGAAAENRRGGVLITQAEANGRFLGEIVIGAGANAAVSARLHRVADLPPADTGEGSFAATVIGPIRDRVENLRGDVIGQVVSEGLDWGATRADRYSGECALANFMNDALVAALQDDDPVDLAMVNGGSLLAGVTPGPLTFGDWFRVMPYADEIFVLEARAAEIAEILRSNARRLLRPEERAGTDVDGFLPRGFLQFSAGLRYVIETGGSAGEADIGEIRLLGKPLAAHGDARIRIATTTYLALGSFGERWNGAPIAGGVPGNLPGHDLRVLPSRNTGLVYRDVLCRHIRSVRDVTAAKDGRVHIVPAELPQKHPGHDQPVSR